MDGNGFVPLKRKDAVFILLAERHWMAPFQNRSHIFFDAAVISRDAVMRRCLLS